MNSPAPPNAGAAAPVDPAALARSMTDIAAECQRVAGAYWAGQAARAGSSPDPLGVLPAIQAMQAQWLAHPAALMRAQTDALKLYFSLWQGFFQRLWGMAPAPVVRPAPGDRRFRDSEWMDNPFFDFVKQSYLIAANSLTRLAQDTPGLDPKTAHKAAFYIGQFADALSPTNFVASNPEVLRATLDSGGRNLVDGLRHLVEDFDPAQGRLRPRMVDDRGFELGRTIATSPGKVAFQNALMQLLQYAPSTPAVKRRPLLIIPPWINKFYVLDLQARNSFIRWAVGEGHTVFVISWVNPGPELRDRDFEDYVFEGPLAALDAMTLATGERSFNVIGYCIGGTLLGATLALLRAQGDTRVASATFFTALLDFSDVGDIGVFIDDAQIENLEHAMDKRGYLDGQEMSTAFNMIRANDLIWSFVVNNYLLGREPAAFDLLYWNSDSTRMPARMHSTYLNRMYRDNALRMPGAIALRGVPVDLAKIDVPACFVSAVEDHIAPWKTTYLGAQLLSGEVDFLLSKAGHVAGIINPPGPRAYGHFTGPRVAAHLTSDAWLAQASAREGSWWATWAEWVARFADGEVPAREPGAGGLPALEDAPGSYVRCRNAA